MKHLVLILNSVVLIDVLFNKTTAVSRGQDLLTISAFKYLRILCLPRRGVCSSVAARSCPYACSAPRNSS